MVNAILRNPFRFTSTLKKLLRVKSSQIRYSNIYPCAILFMCAEYGWQNLFGKGCLRYSGSIQIACQEKQKTKSQSRKGRQKKKGERSKAALHAFTHVKLMSDKALTDHQQILTSS